MIQVDPSELAQQANAPSNQEMMTIEERLVGATGSDTENSVSVYIWLTGLIMLTAMVIVVAYRKSRE